MTIKKLVYMKYTLFTYQLHMNKSTINTFINNISAIGEVHYFARHCMDVGDL